MRLSTIAAAALSVTLLLQLGQSTSASADGFNARTFKLSKVPVGTTLRMEWGFYVAGDEKEWGRTVEFEDTTAGCFLTPAQKVQGKEFDFMGGENLIVSKVESRGRDTDLASNQLVQIHLRWDNVENGETEYFGVIDCFLVNGPVNHSLTVQAIQTLMPELWFKLPGATAPRDALRARDTRMEFAKTDGFTVARRRK